jgi:hypothetical protein
VLAPAALALSGFTKSAVRLPGVWPTGNCGQRCLHLVDPFLKGLDLGVLALHFVQQHLGFQPTFRHLIDLSEVSTWGFRFTRASQDDPFSKQCKRATAWLGLNLVILGGVGRKNAAAQALRIVEKKTLLDMPSIKAKSKVR